MSKPKQRKSEVPPLTLEDLGIPTPQTNSEHIKRIYAIIDRIIEGMANLRIQLTALEAGITKEKE